MQIVHFTHYKEVGVRELYLSISLGLFLLDFNISDWLRLVRVWIFFFFLSCHSFIINIVVLLFHLLLKVW